MNYEDVLNCPQHATAYLRDGTFGTVVGYTPNPVACKAYVSIPEEVAYREVLVDGMERVGDALRQIGCEQTLPAPKTVAQKLLRQKYEHDSIT